MNLGSWFGNPRATSYLPNDDYAAAQQELQEDALYTIPGYIPDKRPFDVMSLDTGEPLPQRFPEFDTA